MRLSMPFRATALLFAVSCLAVIVAPTSSQAHSSDRRCSVGSPPSIEDGPRLLAKPAGPELVVACGKGVAGPFEIAAYTSVDHTLCTAFLGVGFGSGECGAAFGESRLARDGVLATGTNWAWGAGPGPAYTAIGGWVTPEVARVEVRYHRNNGKPTREADATVGQVDGELLGSLGQSEPFGRFAVVFPGCSLPQGIRILAFDSEGRLLGSESGHKSGFGTPCRPAPTPRDGHAAGQSAPGVSTS